MYLYLDLIWLLNFCINILLLWLTSLFRKQAFTWWRISLAACLGSCYVLLLFFPPLQALFTWSVKALLSIFIIFIAFGFKHLRAFLSNFFTFYFVSFLTGGGILGLHFFFQSQHEVMNGILQTQSSGYGDPISWLFVVGGFIGMFWFSRSRWHQIEVTKRSVQELVEVEVSFGGHQIHCQGLVDTGNQLRDPVTKAPVMMLEQSCFEHVLPELLAKQLLDQDMMQGFNMEAVQEYEEWTTRIRVIPYRGVRQGMQLMYALKPDYVKIILNQESYISSQVLIGLNQQSLSREGLFQAVVHPDLLQNHHKEEAIVSCLSSSN